MDKKKLTVKDLEILKGIANRSWQIVSQDLPLSTTYSRAEVFEMAVDADRLRGFCEDLDQVKLVDRFYGLEWKEMLKHAEAFFPFESYE